MSHHSKGFTLQLSSVEVKVTSLFLSVTYKYNGEIWHHCRLADLLETATAGATTAVSISLTGITRC
jgi:hypothetical protein